MITVCKKEKKTILSVSSVVKFSFASIFPLPFVRPKA